MPRIPITKEAMDAIVADSISNNPLVSFNPDLDEHGHIYVDMELYVFLLRRRQVGDTWSDVIIRLYKEGP